MTNPPGAMPPLPERNRLMTLTAPRTIWLNVFTGDPDGEFPADHEGITWCEDEAGDVDVPYVRADINAQLIARVAELEAERDKLMRHSITVGDAMHDHIVAMGAAVIDGHLQTHAHGLQWIVNTLAGPGLLPDLDEAKALGGAQAWFDHEMAKHEEFRRTHPGPAAIAAKD